MEKEKLMEQLETAQEAVEAFSDYLLTLHDIIWKLRQEFEKLSAALGEGKE